MLNLDQRSVHRVSYLHQWWATTIPASITYSEAENRLIVLLIQNNYVCSCFCGFLQLILSKRLNDFDVHLSLKAIGKE